MQKVKLNIVPKGVKKTTYLSQNDNGRVVRYELFNELLPYTLDGSETITVKVVRPDGEEILTSIENTFEGKAYIDVSFNDDMSAITGVGAGEIKIKDGETELGSHNFDINVESDAYNGKDVVIETETGTLLSFNTEVEDNALEYESEIPYNAAGYTGLRVINTRTAPVYDKTPYLFRKTPSGSGNSCIEKLNGLTVAFNQKVGYQDQSITTNGISISLNALTGKITVTVNNPTGYAQINFNNSNMPKGHKILLASDNALADGMELYCFNIYVKGSYEAPRNKQIIGILNNSANVYFYVPQTVANGTYEYRIIAIDLTQMLGSTIADYIYNLETQTAGAGVSLFKSLGFDKPYYAYNASSLLSSKPVSKKVVGKNLFNKNDSVLGQAISTSNGAFVNNTEAYRTNYIRISPNTNFIISGISNRNFCFVAYYDANKNYIDRSSGAARTELSATTPSNCYYIAFNQYGNEGAGSTSLIDTRDTLQIEYGSTATAYEPYKSAFYDLGGDTLRGLLKLDANNNIYADGDIKTSDGNIKRRYGIVDLGSLEWIRNTQGFFNASLYGLKFVTDTSKLPNLISLPYITDTPAHVYAGTTDKTISTATGGPNIWIRDAAYSDPTAFQAAVSGVYLIYELATPTTESSTPFDNPQEARVTEEFIDERSIPIPVGHDTIYGTDIEYQDIDFNTTIYGGEIDAVNGVLSSEYNSDGSVKPTPEIIDITPTPIPVRAGDNNIFNSADGNQTIRYYNQVEE